MGLSACLMADFCKHIGSQISDIIMPECVKTTLVQDRACSTLKEAPHAQLKGRSGLPTITEGKGIAESTLVQSKPMLLDGEGGQP